MSSNRWSHIALVGLIACSPALGASAADNPKPAATTQSSPNASAADALFDKGQYAEAAMAYRKQLNGGAGDATRNAQRLAMSIRLSGASAAQGSWTDEETAWEAALRADPKDLATLRGWFEMTRERATATPTDSTIRQLRDAGGAVLKRDAKDARAAAWLDASYLIASVANVDVADADVDQHLTALVGRMKNDATLSDAGIYAPLVCFKQARQMRSRNAADAADKRIAEGVTMFEPVVAARPEDPAVLLRMYQILRAADEAVREDNPKAPAETSYAQRVTGYLATAREHVKPGEPAFSEVYEGSVADAIRRRQKPEAERLAREWLEKSPTDQQGRRVLASLLRSDPGGRDEAIQLLHQPVTDPGGPGVLGVHNAKTMAYLTQLELVNLLVEARAAATPATVEAIQRDLDAQLARLEEIGGRDFWSVLMARGKATLVRGGPLAAVEAIPYLEKAREAYKHASGSRGKDWDLEYLLGEAYLASNQTGLAKTQLFAVVDAVPNAAAPHKALARLLISERDLDLAREQLDALKKASPDDPDVPKLERALAAAHALQAGGAEAAKAADAMPEGTRAEVLAKAQLDVTLGRQAEATRLYESLRAKDAGDIEAVRPLAQLYLAQGKRDAADKVVSEAVAKSPEDAALQILRAQLDGDVERVKALTLKGIEATADPVRRELGLFDFYLGQNDRASALAHLDAAERLRPDDATIQDQQFNQALAIGAWDRAGQYLDKLATRNADEAGGLIYRFRLQVAQRQLDEATATADEVVRRYPQYARGYVCQGDVLRLKGQSEQAIARYNAALERQTGNVQAYEGIIDCYLKLEKVADAKRYLDEAFRLHPENAGFRQQVANWDLAHGDADAAIAKRKADREANPDSLDAAMAVGAACVEAARHRAGGDPAKASAWLAEARQAFEHAATRWPDEQLPYAFLADMGIEQHDLAYGQRWLETFAAREKWKDSPRPSLMLGEYFEKLRKPELAEGAYGEAMKKGKLALSAQLRIAQFLVSRGKYEQALASLDASSNDPATQQLVMQILVGQGKTDEAENRALALAATSPERAEPVLQQALTTLLNARRFDDVIAKSTEWLKVEPLAARGWWLYQARALATAANGHPEQTSGDFDLALGIASKLPGDGALQVVARGMAKALGEVAASDHLAALPGPGPRWKLLALNLDLGRRDVPRAVGRVEKILEEVDQYSPAERQAVYSFAGLTYTMAHDVDKAVAMYEKLVAIAPDDAVALNNLASLWSEEHNPPDPAKAMEYGGRAMRVVEKSGQPADPSLLDTYGWALVQAGKAEEGAKYLRASLQKRDSAETHYHLGRALAQQGKAAEAKVEFEDAEQVLRREPAPDGRLLQRVREAKGAVAKE